MKSQDKSNERLLKFAQHLEQIKNHPEQGIFDTVEFVELELRKERRHKILYHAWVFEELPLIFKEWGFNGKFGNPLPDDIQDEEGTVAAVLDFFDLTLFEFCHLFNLEGIQDPQRYGGKHLTFEADGPDLAQNIRDLVAARISKKSSD